VDNKDPSLDPFSDSKTNILKYCLHVRKDFHMKKDHFVKLIIPCLLNEDIELLSDLEFSINFSITWKLLIAKALVQSDKCPAIFTCPNCFCLGTGQADKCYCRALQMNLL
jgi:hypothetical protein